METINSSRFSRSTDNALGERSGSPIDDVLTRHRHRISVGLLLVAFAVVVAVVLLLGTLLR